MVDVVGGIRLIRIERLWQTNDETRAGGCIRDVHQGLPPKDFDLVTSARPNQISYQLDGTDANTQGNGSPGSAAGGLLGVETVREFQVLVNNYSAEYGRSTGGIVTAVTRSGTNTVNGTLFEFNRDSRFDSRTYFDNPSDAIPRLKRNQFGGYLGGPVVKDRTFFFGSYEGLRQDRGLTTIATVPSRATRTRTDISAVTRPYLLLYPEPNGRETGATGLYSVQVTAPTRENYALGKIDHMISNAHSISMRYSWDKARVDQQYADTVVRSDENFSDNMNGMFTEYALNNRLSQVATDENLHSSYLALYNELAN